MPARTTNSLGAIWSGVDAKFSAAIVRDMAWMPAEHRRLAEMLRQARLLFSDAHREFFVEEGRSEFAFQPIRKGRPDFYQEIGLLGLISIKTADLQFSEAPRISIGNEPLQKRIDDIVERSWFHAQLIEGATDGSWAGRAYLEITRVAGDAYIGHVPADEIYPVGSPGPDQQHRSYLRYSTASIGGEAGTKEIKLLLEVTYSPGRITRKLYELEAVGAGGATRSRELSLDQWPTKTVDGQPLPAEEITGLSRPSIVAIPNNLKWTSDYDGLIKKQDAVNAKETQVSRVLEKHASPKIYFPGTPPADDDGDLDAEDDAYYGDGPEGKPSYITWEAQLDAAMQDREFAMNVLIFKAEFTRSLLGLKDDATAETAEKMRLNASNPLAKAQRKSLFWQYGIKLAIALAIEAETGARPTLPIGVEMRDGLPDDEGARADTIATLRGANVISRRRSLRMQWLDEAAIEDEIAELEQEAQAQMPGTLLGEPPVGIEMRDKLPDDEGASDAGVATDVALNGAQIQAVINVVGQLQAGAIGRTTAIELLVATGISRDRATIIVNDSGQRTGAGEPPVAGQGATINEGAA